MAVEKSRVVGRFKAKFGTIGLSTKRLDEVSAKLSARLNDDASDEDIDGKLDELNEVYPFSEIKRNDDRLLNEINNPNKAPKPADAAPAPSGGDDDPVTQLLNVVKSLQGEISAIKEASQSQSIQERFRKDERIAALKGIPDHAFSGRIPKTEDEYESSVESFVNDWKPFLEKHKLGDQGRDKPPTGTGGAGDDKEVKSISKEQATAIAKEMGSY